LAHSAGHEMLDLRGWNAQGGGAFALILGDQRAGDIVAVARALFDRVGRRHAVPVAIKQHPGEQAWLMRAGDGVALGGIASKLCLNRIPERLIDDWRVFAPVGLELVNNLAKIDAVPQHQVEPTAREWLAADAATRSARPASGYDPPDFELLLQQPDRAEFAIAAEDQAYEFCLAVDDDKLAVPAPDTRAAAPRPSTSPFALRRRSCRGCARR
jgi:hypothetical protein